MTIPRKRLISGIGQCSAVPVFAGRLEM